MTWYGNIYKGNVLLLRCVISYEKIHSNLKQEL